MIYHMIAFGLGFCLDLLLGDPYWLPHHPGDWKFYRDIGKKNE